ncbi:MAG: hypothetical protein ACYDHM_00705 [Acidiferrobacterales bacterium]
MTLHIHPGPIPSKAALRNLVASSLDAFLGPASVLDVELACTGCPILALDASRRLTLVSFDPEDGIQALLSGLTAWHETRAGQPWLKRLYPELRPPDASLVPRLIVLMPELPPGIGLIAQKEGDLQIFCFRVLAVDGQTALLVEPVTESPAAPATGPAPQSAQPVSAITAEITEEETAFLESGSP